METKQDDFTQQEVFDRMAPGWYSRRHWTIFRTELETLAARWQGGRLLNVGCGHGADFLPFKNGFELYGIDFSREMLRFGRKYSDKFRLNANLVQADAAGLPFTSDSFDLVIAVASLHHLQTPEARNAGYKELFRVLKPGGEAFVTVWNRWQPSFWFKGKQTRVTWRTKAAELERYYYLFSRWELERLVKRNGFRILASTAEASYRFPVKAFSRNVCLLLKKNQIDK